jgi:hypothetical protein
MIKVSFKESKEVQKFNDKVTLVTLYGKTKYCGKINFLPMEIVKWVHTHPIVDNISFGLGSIHIKATGKTVRSDADKDNPILAERIAESRAKIKVYKFMHTLCNKLYKYYCKVAFGQIDFVPAYYVSGSLYRELQKYYSLLLKESLHLEDLIEES